MNLDYHFFEFKLHTLERAGSKQIIEVMTDLGIDSLWLCSEDHWGGMQQVYEPQVWVDAPDRVGAVCSRRGNEIRVVLIHGIHSKVIAGDPWGAEAARRGRSTPSSVVPVRDLTVKVRGLRDARASDLKGMRLKTSHSGAVTAISVPAVDQYELVRIRR
ncbi:MAG: hypothetical protein HXY20_11380 [Acidobacteria bacterium]|nr:hypothetical protein [Acidobacteriota bacterium]